jgi:outer membrane protein assembly factor BamB
LLAVCVFSAADWLSFRGGASGSAQRAPVVSGEERVAWKAELPGRGVSGPIVVDGSVVATSATGADQRRLHVSCFDSATGKPRWERQFWATGRTICHPTSSVAAPTPASDGQRIFAFFSSNDLICLDLDGNLLWYRGLAYDYPHAGNDIGMASSPVVVGETVVVQIENQGDSFAAGLDTATGETRWRVDRDREANWASPVAMRGATPKDDLVLLQSGSKITAHQPRTGKLAWSFDAACSTIPTAAVVDDVVYLPATSLTALRYRSGSAAVEILWENSKLLPGSASPVVHQGRVYALNRAGVLNCGTAADGQPAWQLRLKGPVWATPAAAGDRLYVVNQDGLLQIVQLGDKGELAGEKELGEEVLGSPAVADGLYIRGAKHLFKISS